MKLIILRHAKSSWDAPHLSDHDRPLAPRGQRAALTVGNWLGERGHHPGSVICSSALRTRETWSRVRGSLPEPEEIRFERGLYHAGAAAISAIMRTARASPLMIIGHNPGIGEFARSSLASPPPHDGFNRYPTAAVTVCEFEAEDWRAVVAGTGILIDFTVPRDIR